MARKNKFPLADFDATQVASVVAAEAEAEERDTDEIVLVEASDDMPPQLDELGLFSSDMLADGPLEVNPLGVRAPRTKTSMNLEEMSVTIGETSFEVGRLSQQTCNRLVLEGLKSVLLRDGVEAFSELEAGTYRTREPAAPKPTIRAAVAMALMEKGMDPDLALQQVEGLDRATLGRLKRDPDVARQLAAMRGEASVLDALIA